MQTQNAHLAIASVPVQSWGELYDQETALKTGTIFKDLDLPFFAAGQIPETLSSLEDSLNVNNGELVPSARSNCTTLPKQEYRLAGWLYRSATALCQRCEPLFR